MNLAVESNLTDQLFSEVSGLYQRVCLEAGETYHTWLPYIERTPFAEGAHNLAHYLALRKHDIRPLQRDLAVLGLSSLGRVESRVLPTLEATLATLGQMRGDSSRAHPKPETMFAGEERLQAAAREFFGPSEGPRILATLPEEMALNHRLVQRLADAGMGTARINCAHADRETWIPMIENLRRVAAEKGRTIPILMDLCGPRLRTESVWAKRKIEVGDHIALSASQQRVDRYEFQAAVSIPKALSQLEVGQRVFIDDGKLEAKVEEVGSELVEIRVTEVSPKGFKLQAEKGLNFPDTRLELEALSLKDLEDLDFATKNADLIGYSFVQRVSDLYRLFDELEARRPLAIRGIVLKIETAEAVANLPQLIVHAAGRWPIAIMIARGDLAIELGFERLAEMQEEILWLAEAASVPVIWATQVLDRLVKKGTSSRAEVSDAVLAARSECVMLNKGPYLEKAIGILSDVLQRMQEHQYKKFPKMRPLRVWQ